MTDQTLTGEFDLKVDNGVRKVMPGGILYGSSFSYTYLGVRLAPGNTWQNGLITVKSNETGNIMDISPSAFDASLERKPPKPGDSDFHDPEDIPGYTGPDLSAGTVTQEEIDDWEEMDYTDYDHNWDTEDEKDIPCERACIPGIPRGHVGGCTNKDISVPGTVTVDNSDITGTEVKAVVTVTYRRSGANIDIKFTLDRS